MHIHSWDHPQLGPVVCDIYVTEPWERWCPMAAY